MDLDGGAQGGRKLWISIRFARQMAGNAARLGGVSIRLIVPAGLKLAAGQPGKGRGQLGSGAVLRLVCPHGAFGGGEIPVSGRSPHVIHQGGVREKRADRERRESQSSEPTNCVSRGSLQSAGSGIFICTLPRASMM